MTGQRAAPIRFLIGVTGLWVAGRGAVLLGWQPPSPLGRGILMAATPRPPSPVPPRIAMSTTRPAPRLPARADRSLSAPAGTSAMAPAPVRHDPADAAATLPPLAATMPDSGRRRATGGTDAAATAGPLAIAHRSRWSGSAWAFVRGGGGSPLAPGGQIGGSQAGARILYRLDGSGHFAASARISRSLAGPTQTEAAFGIDWKPAAALPLHLTAERRVAIDRGGRNAFALGVAGGAYAVPLAMHFRLDAYGEAGVVGAHRRDLYADGAARIARAIDLGAGRSLAIGAGLFGAAQPGASRLDVGPGAVLRMPVAGRTFAVALDWRERIAGAARPGSGPALTIGADF